MVFWFISIWLKFLVGGANADDNPKATSKLCHVGEREKMLSIPKRNGVLEGDGTMQTVTCQHFLRLENNNCITNECYLIFRGFKDGNEVF